MYVDVVVTVQNMICKLSFSITFVNNNPHITVGECLFSLWITLG